VIRSSAVSTAFLLSRKTSKGHSMTSPSPLFKRIKRRVIGRQQRFFAATSPGFEAICLQELLTLQPAAGQACVTPGGVEFGGRLDDCYRGNLHLRLPNRILMRIDAFKSSNFRQLERKVGDIPWELYLHPAGPLKVHVAAKRCRLRHTGAIAERFQQIIYSRQSQFETGDKIQQVVCADQNLYVRGVDDLFTVSIDSSGDLLYKRGLKKHSGKAPLRETLAAAALTLAGYEGSQPLIDPLCGAGTFSLEAALIAKRIPPGWFRDFAFTRWPSFIARRWNYIRRQSESEFVHPARPLIFASDIDQRACQKLQRCVENFGLSDAVEVHRINFFDLDPRKLTARSGLVCMNPPYGRRLGGRAGSEKFFRTICDKLKKDYKRWGLVLFAPGRELARTVPFQTKSYPILHGGLKPALLIGKIE
jgi:putative N6-adenine-specific DNA methylase